MVGILGGVPFVMNCFGCTSPGVWLANYLVRPDYRRGALAVRLLNMFRQPLFTVTIAFGVGSAAVPLYTALRARVLETIPRHVAIFPEAVERVSHLLHLTYPDWPAARVRAGKGVALPSEPRRSRPIWDNHSRQLGHARLAAMGRVHGWGSTRHGVLALALPEPPDFPYRILTVREGKRTGLAVWRLETIHRATQGREPVDRIGRLVEFLPASHANAQALLACFWQALREGRHRRRLLRLSRWHWRLAARSRLPRAATLC